jgi:hypothetical protein
MSRIGYIVTFSVVGVVVIVLGVLGYLYRDELFTTVAPEERTRLEKNLQDKFDSNLKNASFCKSFEGGVYDEVTSRCYCDSFKTSAFKITLSEDVAKIESCQEAVNSANASSVSENCSLSCAQIPAVELEKEKTTTTQINKSDLVKNITAKLDGDMCETVGGDYTNGVCECSGNFAITKADELTGEEEQAVLQECSRAFEGNMYQALNVCGFKCVPLVAAANACIDPNTKEEINISDFKCAEGSIASKNTSGSCVCDQACVDPITGKTVGVSGYANDNCKTGEFVKIEEGTNKCVCTTGETTTTTTKTEEGLPTTATPKQEVKTGTSVSVTTPETPTATTGQEVKTTETPKTEAKTAEEVKTETTPTSTTTTTTETKTTSTDETKQVAVTGAEDNLYIASIIALACLLIGSGVYASSRSRYNR